MTDVYYGGFESWQDVVRSFQEDPDEMPIPDEVLYAGYDVGRWEIGAEIYYRIGNSFFEVSVSECSLYGLKGQWRAEEYDRETFIAALKKRQKSIYAAREKCFYNTIIDKARASQ